MTYVACKNCNHPATDNYCAQCAQSTDTHRLSWKHFVHHDILHGVFHLEGVMPKTLKAILNNPGVVANNYIAGKRKRYYNFFYLMLLLIATFLILRANLRHEDLELLKKQTNSSKHGTVDLTGFIYNHTKVIVFALVPILAIPSYILIRRYKYNFVEHTIMAICTLVGSYFLYLIYYISKHSFKKLGWQSEIMVSINEVLSLIISVVAFLYPIVAYYTWARMAHYKVMGVLWRMLVFIIISFLLLTLLFAFITFWVSGSASKAVIHL